MIYVSGGMFLLGVAGVVFGLHFYHELWKWARQCQGVYIAVAHKKRVQLQGPITEWLTWGNALGKDERVRGRTIYRNGQVSISLYRPEKPQSPGRIRASISRVKNARKRGKAPAQTR